MYSEESGNNGNVQMKLTQVKNYLARTDVKNRFGEILGNKSQQFMASIVNAVSNNYRLQACDPNSIMAAAFVAASLDLPIDSNLGFAALVPYGNVCQFQMMYKGYVQLAIRTGAYERMNCSEVYADEIVRYNPITAECDFVDDFSQCRDRASGDPNKVVGYHAWFRLRNGFGKELYMSKAEIINHAMKYSKAYRADRKYQKNMSPWSTMFDTMAKKTVLKLLLSRWGVLSIGLQRAITEDQKTFDSNGVASYGDNQPDEVVVSPADEVKEPNFGNTMVEQAPPAPELGKA